MPELQNAIAYVTAMEESWMEHCDRELPNHYQIVERQRILREG